MRSLPQILEGGETIIRLSLGAGNTGRDFDLETDRRVAEFKFVVWRGRDAVRLKNLFQDFYRLAEYETDRRKELYVNGTERPLRFLKGRRAIKSVLSGNSRLATEFENRFGREYSTVSQYAKARGASVLLIDATEYVPELALA